MKYFPAERNYQVFSTDHIINNLGCGLFLDMGLGKTVSTLTAIDKLIYSYLEVSKVLVIAPLKTAQSTWSDEIEKWEHLRHLKLSKVLGSEKERIAALKAHADIYIINQENVQWLVAYFGARVFPFDMLVIDELSGFKDANSARFKALRTIRPLINRVVGLTGTPAPEGLINLWSQLYLLDMGERLGEKLTDYKSKWFTVDPYKPHAKPQVRKETSKIIGADYYEKKIYEQIGDICISMKSEDYLELPECIEQIVHVHLPDKVREQYDQFEEERVLELLNALDEGETLTAVNAAVLCGKLLQFAGGAVYSADPAVYHEFHTEKIKTLHEQVEAANGQPVLVSYWFKHELERILRDLKAFKPVHFKTPDDLKRWNNQEIRLLLGHPGSMGHGLNMQAGGNTLINYSNFYSAEKNLQLIKRIHRSGQTKPVFNKRLVAVGTIDEAVIEALAGKVAGQNALLEATKAIIKKYQ
jgi:SNF2 family DNA or RNA helicase